MGIHEKAWQGTNILIFGNTPLVPMRLEQAIVQVSPENEIRIDSFENYDDAYDFCKQQGNIGFIFLLENCGKYPPGDVFRQLGRFYEKRGWPATGVLLYENTESLLGHKILRNNPNIIDYLHIDNLINLSITETTINNIWGKYLTQVGSTICPASLKDTLHPLAQNKYGKEGLLFIERICSLLLSNLNISWLEAIALDWIFFVKECETYNPLILSNYGTLKDIVKLAEPLSLNSSLDILTSKESLPKKISSIALILNEKRQIHKLEQELMLISTQSKPGVSALIRHIAKAKDRIIQISQALETEVKKEMTG